MFLFFSLSLVKMKAYKPIPVIAEFKNENGTDRLNETVEANYKMVKKEVLYLVGK